MTIPQLCKRLSISEQTFYRWRIKYGALKEDGAQRMNPLEQESDVFGCGSGRVTRHFGELSKRRSSAATSSGR